MSDLEKLIETMARAINDEIGDGDVSLAASQQFANSLATAALTAIEAAGMRVVPVEPSERMLDRMMGGAEYRKVGADLVWRRNYTVMLCARQEDSTSE